MNPMSPIPTKAQTPCCGYTPAPGVEWPVMWNPFNEVVQCHNCGHIYEPVNRLRNVMWDEVTAGLEKLAKRMRAI